MAATVVIPARYGSTRFPAKILASDTGKPLVQHVVERAKREENLKDAFGLVKERSIRDKHVLIVDDIMTTGATLQSFARTLRHAEPASLSVLVLAVADPLGQDFQVI